MDWIHVAWNIDWWQALVNVIWKLQVNSSTILATIDFFERILLHGLG